MTTTLNIVTVLVMVYYSIANDYNGNFSLEFVCFCVHLFRNLTAMWGYMEKKINGYEGFFKHEITSEVDIDPLK